MVILGGVLLCLGGISLCGWAGMSKEGELTEEQKKAAVNEFALGKGFAVAAMAGILSACFAFGLAAGKPIADQSIASRNGAGLLEQCRVGGHPARRLRQQRQLVPDPERPQPQFQGLRPARRRGRSQLCPVGVGRGDLVRPVLLLRHGLDTTGREVRLLVVVDPHGVHHRVQQPVGDRVPRMARHECQDENTGLGRHPDPDRLDDGDRLRQLLGHERFEDGRLGSVWTASTILSQGPGAVPKYAVSEDRLIWSYESGTSNAQQTVLLRNDVLPTAGQAVEVRLFPEDYPRGQQDFAGLALSSSETSLKDRQGLLIFFLEPTSGHLRCWNFGSGPERPSVSHSATPELSEARTLLLRLVRVGQQHVRASWSTDGERFHWLPAVRFGPVQAIGLYNGNSRNSRGNRLAFDDFRVLHCESPDRPEDYEATTPTWTSAFEVARSRIRENSGVFREGQRPAQSPNSHEFGYSPSKCATSKTSADAFLPAEGSGSDIGWPAVRPEARPGAYWWWPGSAVTKRI
jgi:hypothetical protein